MPDEQNLVSSPPLTSPVLDQTGRFARAWARWFQQLYFRTSFQGGNVIDEAAAEIEQTNQDIIQFTPFKGLVVEFKGQVTVGPVAIVGDSYNVFSVERTAPGVYVVTANQLTAYGYNLFDLAVVSIEFLISPSVNTELFDVKSFQVAEGVFNIFINEVTKGVGNDLVKTPYDPTGLVDAIRIIVNSSIGTGELPPP